MAKKVRQMNLHQPYERGVVDINNAHARFEGSSFSPEVKKALIQPLLDLQASQAPPHPQGYTSSGQLAAIVGLQAKWQSAVSKLDQELAERIKSPGANKEELIKERKELEKMIGEVSGEFYMTLNQNREWNRKKARDYVLGMGTGDYEYELMKRKFSRDEKGADISLEKDLTGAAREEMDEKILHSIRKLRSPRSGMEYTITKNDKGQDVYTANFRGENDQPKSLQEETAANMKRVQSYASASETLKDYYNIVEAKGHKVMNINTKNNPALDRETLVEMYINSKLQQEWKAEMARLEKDPTAKVNPEIAKRYAAIRYPLDKLNLNGVSDYKNYDYSSLAKQYKGINFETIEKLGEQQIKMRSNQMDATKTAIVESTEKSMHLMPNSVDAKANNKSFKDKFSDKLASINPPPAPVTITSGNEAPLKVSK